MQVKKILVFLLVVGLMPMSLVAEEMGENDSGKPLITAFGVPLLEGQDPEAPSFLLQALIDARVIRTDKAQSWLDHGLGKTRYGGEDRDEDERAEISQAALLLTGKLNENLAFFAHTQLDLENYGGDQRGRFDLIEAFAQYKTFVSDFVQVKFRGGFYFPEVSLENQGPAWTSLYTLTPSAANSWIADEVRNVGGELTLDYSYLQYEASVTAGMFQVNDPAGSLLAWRGWAFGDRLTGVDDRLALPPVPSIEEGGIFAPQATYNEPFDEIDERLGYYGSFHLADQRYAEFSGFYYNNHGDRSIFDGVQYAWATEFFNFGLRSEAIENLALVSQLMFGNTQMGDNPFGGPSVDNDFWTYFALASYQLEQHRFSLRFDKFGVDDKDIFREEDNNQEDGWGFTFAYFYEYSLRHRFGFEYLRVESDRDVRRDVGLETNETENLFQLSYRLLL